MDRKSLSILHLLSYHLFTGPVEPVLRLARAQLDAGHRPRLAFDRVRDGDLEEQAARFGVPTETRFSLSVKSGPILLLRDLLALKRIWAGQEFDIVHAHRSHDHTLAALARPRQSTVRLVRSLHTERTMAPNRRWLLGRADGLVTVGQRFRADLLDRGLLDADRIVAVDGAVDGGQFCPGEGGEHIRSEAGVEAQAPVAGIVARMKAGRGHDCLLAAWAQVVQKLPTARLLLVGRGELATQLRSQVAAAPWASSVRFLGYRKDLAQVYRAFDVKVMLAPGNDGTCRAALEAMASGVPLLVCDRGALAEIVRDGISGKVVPGDNPQLLAEALVDLLASPNLRRKLGAQARLETENRFTIKAQLASILNLYLQVLDK